MRRSLVLLAALVFFSGLSGCGRLLGARYHNFTAYYNTFYNARVEFEREVERLLDQERPVERDRFLPLFTEPEAQGSQSAGFEKAIEKGADLLREHPESKWVDDALLLIGKAYFYQGNLAGAEQKFREVIELDEDQHEDEAYLWLGRTLTLSESYDEAALTLREGLDREGVRERWAAPMRLALAEVDVRRGDVEEAVTSLETGIEGLRDKDLAARATFLLGQVYEVLDQPAEAADAYEQVLRYGPRYELAYAAQLSQALALGFYGEAERGLDLLQRMRRDDKNFQNLAQVELARARVLAAADRSGEARDLLRTLLYDPDPTLQAGSIRGLVHYHLAEVYREDLDDYIQAAAHYDTAATAINTPTDLNVRYTREAVTDAERRADTFGNYARVVGEIAEMDSLLYLGGLDDEAFTAAIEEIRAERLREADERERELARRRAEQGFGNIGLEDFDPSQESGGRGETGGDEGTAGAGAQEEGMGFLSFRNPVRVQEQLISFQARWGDRPHVPNWRRAAAIGGEMEVQLDLEEVVENVPGVQTPGLVGDDLVDVSAIPRDPIAQQRVRIERAAARYELGNVLFLALGEPESAAPWYRQVIEENPESDVAQRAYFALAEAQRTLGNEAEADDLYRQVLDRYPESALADQVRERLGMEPRERVAVADSLAEAEAAYSLAYRQWEEGAYAEALDAMLSVSERYPTTSVAPRARFAAGALYTEWAAGDSTALLSVLPRLALQPDAPEDSAAAPVSVVLPEEVVLSPADTLASDTLATDSLSIEPDVLAADSSAADSSAAPVAPPEATYEDPWLYALYASIEQDYPGTSYAERARATRTALRDMLMPASQDSVAADSVGGLAGGEEPRAPALEMEGVAGEGIDPGEGGFSWAVSAPQSETALNEAVASLAEQGYRVALYQDTRSARPIYYILIGQFETEDEAQAVASVLPRPGQSIMALSEIADQVTSPPPPRQRNEQ